MDQAVISSEKPKSGGIGEPSVDHGRGIYQGKKLLARVKRASRLYDFLKIVVDDLMIVHGPCVERDISFFLAGRSVWK